MCFPVYVVTKLFMHDLIFSFLIGFHYFIIITILFESGNTAHTQTHKDIQTDRQTE